MKSIVLINNNSFLRTSKNIRSVNSDTSFATGLIVFITILFAVVIIAGIINGIRRGTQKRNVVTKKHTGDLGLLNSKNLQSKTSTGYLSTERSRVRDTILNMIVRNFAETEGWDYWKPSTHQVNGQFERCERAVKQKLPIIAYDPDFKLAKIRGTSGNIYLTSSRRCSCGDFRDRGLPCKHMYSLCIALEGDVNQRIVDTQHKSLYGLKFALAGRFSGSKNGPEGIRTKINNYEGRWDDDILRDASALVCGNSPSESKIQHAKRFNMEILDVTAVLSIFSGAKFTKNQVKNVETKCIDSKCTNCGTVVSKKFLDMGYACQVCGNVKFEDIVTLFDEKEDQI